MSQGRGRLATLASFRSTSTLEGKLPEWGPPLVASDPPWHTRAIATGPTMVASSIITPFTQGGSSGWRRSFSTSGRTRATAPLKAPTEEDSLQVNIRIIKQ